MATAAILDIEPQASTSIATVVAQTPEIVLVDGQKREQLYEHIQREVDAFEPDLTTAKGREAIKSFAFKITRTKTAIDAAGKKLNEEARQQINAVDAARRDARDKLDAMAKAVRAPLTEWEEAEEKRVAWCRQVIQDFKRGAVVMMDDTAETVRARGKLAFEVIVSAETFGDMFGEAVAAKDSCVSVLKAALARLTQEEADRLELERLRAEAAERERIDAERAAAEEAERAAQAEREREAQQAREAEERAAREAEAEKERRAAAEQAEAARIERARQEAADNAAREAEERARNAAAQREAEHEAALAAERRRSEEAAKVAQAELERVAREEADRQAKIDQQAAERAEREENQAHRAKLKTAAKEALIALGIPEAKAIKVVQAIVAGDVPHVRMEF